MPDLFHEGVEAPDAGSGVDGGGKEPVARELIFQGEGCCGESSIPGIVLWRGEYPCPCAICGGKTVLEG